MAPVDRKYRLLARHFPFSHIIYKYCIGSKSVDSFSRKYVPEHLDVFCDVGGAGFTINTFLTKKKHKREKRRKISSVQN